MGDVDNDELMDEEIPDVLEDRGKNHIGDLDDEPSRRSSQEAPISMRKLANDLLKQLQTPFQEDELINEDEVTPEQYAEMKVNRKLTTTPPEIGKMYDLLSHLREGYRMLRTLCINERHTEYMDILNLLDLVIRDWVVECNEVDDKTKVVANKA